MFWPLREIAEDAKGLVLKLRRRLERIRDMYTQGLDKDNNWRG